MSVETSVDEVVHEYVSDEGAGVAVLVMNNNEPVLIKGYGSARIASPDHGIAREEVSNDTVFDLASSSKQFTAIAILMLIDQTTRSGPAAGKYRKLCIHTPLSDFFPKIPRASDITIQNLLNHSSNLPDYLGLDADEDWYNEELSAEGYWYSSMKAKDSYLTNEQIIALISDQPEDEIHPRSKFEYCNTGYVILAEIIRKLTDKPLREFLKEEIFKPLQMGSTFVYDKSVGEFTKHSLCYRKNGTEYVSIKGDTRYNCINGDGNVHSTIYDMVKWQKALNRIDDLDKFFLAGFPRLITEQTFLDVFRPLIQNNERLRYQPGRKGYSAGFHIYRFQNRNVSDFAIHHGGEWLGFQSYLMRGQVRFKKARILRGQARRISVVVLSNLYSLDSGKIAQDLAQIYWRSWGLPMRYDVLRYVL
jgi:CubicO group peptidase (beta-lactamase class C family)